MRTRHPDAQGLRAANLRAANAATRRLAGAATAVAAIFAGAARQLAAEQRRPRGHLQAVLALQRSAADTRLAAAAHRRRLTYAIAGAAPGPSCGPAPGRPRSGGPDRAASPRHGGLPRARSRAVARQDPRAHAQPRRTRGAHPLCGLALAARGPQTPHPARAGGPHPPARAGAAPGAGGRLPPAWQPRQPQRLLAGELHGVRAR